MVAMHQANLLYSLLIFLRNLKSARPIHLGHPQLHKQKVNDKDENLFVCMFRYSVYVQLTHKQSVFRS